MFPGGFVYSRKRPMMGIGNIFKIWYTKIRRNMKMKFQTMGNKKNPVILFFHAMGVTGESSYRVADS